MAHATGPYSVEERAVHGETRWVAIRARGAEWSWLTPEEAVAIGRKWVEQYGSSAEPPRMIAANGLGPATQTGKSGSLGAAIRSGSSARCGAKCKEVIDVRNKDKQQ